MDVIKQFIKESKLSIEKKDQMTDGKRIVQRGRMYNVCMKC